MAHWPRSYLPEVSLLKRAQCTTQLGQQSPIPRGQTSLESRGPHCVSAGKPTASGTSQSRGQRRAVIARLEHKDQTLHGWAGTAQRGISWPAKRPRAPAPRHLRETEGWGCRKLARTGNNQRLLFIFQRPPLSHSPRVYQSHVS